MKKFILYLVVISAVVYGCKKNSGTPPVIQEDVDGVDSRVAAYMTTYNIPGASIAISKNGKLLYKKGYGVANKSNNESVTTASRFRFASVSKTITAVAIMKLVEEGKLSLDQKVFGPGALLGNDFGNNPYAANLQKITVSHLLHHTAGGWRNFIDDPCFGNTGMSSNQLISWALDNVPLAYTPGTKYHYSNFGYLVLGRIIEKITGKAYQQYVKDAILTPVGATQTALGSDTEAGLKTNEVHYYAQGGTETPFMYPVVRNDAPFGWISTPTDMLRLLAAIDSTSTRPDILSPATIKLMRTPSSVYQYYACGLYVEPDPVYGSIWYHFGSLPGTESLVFGTSSGYLVAYVMNSRYDQNNSAATNAMAAMLLEIIDDTGIEWQDIDQF